jgi:hypothetical protein
VQTAAEEIIRLEEIKNSASIIVGCELVAKVFCLLFSTEKPGRLYVMAYVNRNDPFSGTLIDFWCHDNHSTVVHPDRHAT